MNKKLGILIGALGLSVVLVFGLGGFKAKSKTLNISKLTFQNYINQTEISGNLTNNTNKNEKVQLKITYSKNGYVTYYQTTDFPTIKSGKTVKFNCEFNQSVINENYTASVKELK